MGCSKPTSMPALALIGKETNTNTNSVHNFSLEYPKNWDVKEGLSVIYFVFTGPILTITTSVMVEDVGYEFTAEEYSREVEMALKDEVISY